MRETLSMIMGACKAQGFGLATLPYTLRDDHLIMAQTVKDITGRPDARYGYVKRLAHGP
jgi:hypothetical protein